MYKTAVCHRDQSCCKEDHETWLMSFIAPALKVAREPRGREVARGSAIRYMRTSLPSRHLLEFKVGKGIYHIFRVILEMVFYFEQQFFNLVVVQNGRKTKQATKHLSCILTLS